APAVSEVEVDGIEGEDRQGMRTELGGGAQELGRAGLAQAHPAFDRRQGRPRPRDLPVDLSVDHARPNSTPSCCPSSSRRGTLKGAIRLLRLQSFFMPAR